MKTVPNWSRLAKKKIALINHHASNIQDRIVLMNVGRFILVHTGKFHAGLRV